MGKDMMNSSELSISPREEDHFEKTIEWLVIIMYILILFIYFICRKSINRTETHQLTVES